MIRKIIALGSVIALSACVSNEVGDPDIFSPQSQEVFGKAVKQNIAAQTANPDGADGAVTASGARVGKAQDHYRSDTVEKPRGANTLRTTTQSGSSENR